MSTNDNIVEAMTRHQVMIQRLGSGNYKKLEPILDKMAQDIRRRILTGTTEFQLDRLQTLLDEINEIMRSGGAQLSDDLFDSLTEFAQYEAEFETRIVTPLVTVDLGIPSVNQLIGALTTTPATLVSGKNVQRLTIRDMVAKFTEGKRREVDSLVRAGFIEGKTSQQIVSELQSLLGIKAKRQAATLVRTATNHAGSVARKEWANQNRDIIEKEEWVSTLDGRTSLLCVSLDSIQYPVGKGKFPPAHFGCRSVRIPVVDPKYSVFGTNKGERASMDGPVSAKLTYGGWLKRQSKEFQDDVLGPERAALFRSGKVTVDKFVDDLGRSLTLEGLRAREGLTE